MSTLKVATIQSNLYWENPDANLDMFTRKIAGIQEPVDVIVLPEMFTTGFSMNTTFAESPDGRTMQWMQHTAQKYNTAICGSIMIRNRHNEVYNRLVWMNPSGIYHIYNKHHLFSIGKEHEHFKAGSEKVIIEYKGFRLLLMVCYDLRFPVWIRRTDKENYDGIVIIANWPERRIEHWKTLLRARAIENQCYVIAVNRTGTDGNGMAHNGATSLIDPYGIIIYQVENTEETAIHTIHKEPVTAYRQEFGVMNDADGFTLL